MSSDSGLKWEPLPHVLPEQIAVARLVKKVFTGDLEAPVVTWPPFCGTLWSGFPMWIVH